MCGQLSKSQYESHANPSDYSKTAQKPNDNVLYRNSDRERAALMLTAFEARDSYIQNAIACEEKENEYTNPIWYWLWFIVMGNFGFVFIPEVDRLEATLLAVLVPIAFWWAFVDYFPRQNAIRNRTITATLEAERLYPLPSEEDRRAKSKLLNVRNGKDDGIPF